MGEAFQLTRYFKSYMKNRVYQIQAYVESGEGRDQVDAIVSTLREHLTQMGNQLMANEVQLQESIEEAAVDFESKIQDLLKVMGELGSEFFKRLEEHHRVFHVGVIEGANTEMEAFHQNKVRFLGQRDEMLQAITNFNEGQGSMILNKDDAMSGSMTKWKTEYFESHKERQYHRNRTRVLDIKKVIDGCKEEISAASEAAEYDDEHADS